MQRLHCLHFCVPLTHLPARSFVRLPSAWPGLRCQLYRYQRRALSWMLWRESFSRLGAAAGAEGDPDSIKAQAPEASLAWQRVVLRSGSTVFWNPLEGEWEGQRDSAVIGMVMEGS